MSCRFHSRDSQRSSSAPLFLPHTTPTEPQFAQYASLSSGISKGFIPTKSRPNFSQSTRPSGTTFGLVFNHRYGGDQPKDQSVDEPVQNHGRDDG